MMTSAEMPSVDPGSTALLHQLAASQAKTAEQVNTLERQQLVVSADLQRVGSQVEALVKKMEDREKTEWPKYGLIIALIGLVIGPAGILLTLYINGSILPLKSDITQLATDLAATKVTFRDLAVQFNSRDKDVSSLLQSAALNSSRINEISTNQQRASDLILSSQASDVNSKTDRAQLNEQVKKMQEQLAQEIATRQSDDAANRVHRGEIETQFHAVSNIENLRWAWQNRFNSVLFNKTHPGETWPDTSFFPPTIFQSPSGIPDGNLR